MLPLHGHATHSHGFDDPADRHAIRLRAADQLPSHPADFAIVRSTDDLDAAVSGRFAGAFAIGDVPHTAAFPKAISVPDRFSYLGDGDVVGVHPATNRFRTLYRRGSSHNSFLVTERCNHYCLMCSQPPRDIDDRWILREIRKALPLVHKETRSLGFTGGEPLLDWQDFIATLSECRDALPNTAIHVLSNGRAFASPEVAAAWAALAHANLTVGIPVYASVDTVHDYVVQAKGAFDETVMGILRLKNAGQRVEIRVVLHAVTAPRLAATCSWIARNLPFVDHVALMGLENTGFAIANDKTLWIDPLDYQDQLQAGVAVLDAAGVNTSIYNLQRCILPKSLWRFAAQSISDWKNDYVEACEGCFEKPRCSGFFSTGRPKYSRGIGALASEGATASG